MIPSSLMFKAFLLGVLCSLGSGRQTRACSVPYIHEKRGNEKKVINVNSGKDVKLICNIRTTDQTSKPVYYWLRDKQVLILSDHHRMRLKPYRYLRIISAKKKDSGIYICGAVNNCGWNTYTMQLFVGSPALDPNKITVGVKTDVLSFLIRRKQLLILMFFEIKKSQPACRRES